MARGGATGRSFRAHRFEAHQSHEPLGALSVDAESLPDLPRTEERQPDVKAVDLPHKSQILRRLPERLVIPTAPRQANELALPSDAQMLVIGFDA